MHLRCETFSYVKILRKEMEITDLMRTVDGRVALTSCKSDRQNAINALTSRPNLVICNSAS